MATVCVWVWRPREGVGATLLSLIGPGPQRPDLAERPDQGGLPHAERAGDEDLGVEAASRVIQDP